MQKTTMILVALLSAACGGRVNDPVDTETYLLRVACEGAAFEAVSAAAEDAGYHVQTVSPYERDVDVFCPAGEGTHPMTGEPAASYVNGWVAYVFPDGLTEDELREAAQVVWDVETDRERWAE